MDHVSCLRITLLISYQFVEYLVPDSYSASLSFFDLREPYCASSFRFKFTLKVIKVLLGHSTTFKTELNKLIVWPRFLKQVALNRGLVCKIVIQKRCNVQ